MSNETESGRSLVRESGKLSILTMVSRILGLIRERTRGGLMGTGQLADAFTVAFNVPNLFRRLFAEGSMSVAFIPTLKTYFIEGDDEKTKEFLSATFTVLIIVLSTVVVLGIAASPIIVMLFRSEPLETTILMQIMFPFLALVSIAAFFQGILNAQGVFTPSGIAPILFNLSFIAIPYFIGPYTENPARAMAIAVIVGGLAQALCQLPAILKLGSRFGFISVKKAFTNAGMKKVLMLIAPTVLGMAAYEINGMVSASLATFAGVGAVTALSFSLRLLELVLGVFVVSIGTVLLPVLSNFVNTNEWQKYSARLIQSLELVVLITVPVSVFAIIEKEDIVALIFKTQAFSDESVYLTAKVFLFHMLGLPFVGMQRILAPAFYAKSDTKTPAFVGIMAVVVNITAAIILTPIMGASGIALALSVSGFFNAITLMVMLNRAKIDGLDKAFIKIALYTFRLLLFSLIASSPIIIFNLFYKIRKEGSVLFSYGVPFILSAITFTVIGCILLFISKDKALAFLISSFRKKRR